MGCAICDERKIKKEKIRKDKASEQGFKLHDKVRLIDHPCIPPYFRGKTGEIIKINPNNYEVRIAGCGKASLFLREDEIERVEGNAQ